MGTDRCGVETPYVTGCRPTPAQLSEGDRGGVRVDAVFEELVPVEALSAPHAFHGSGGDAEEPWNRVSRRSKDVAAFGTERDVDVRPRVATAWFEPKFSRVRLSSVPGFYWPPGRSSMLTGKLESLTPSRR